MKRYILIFLTMMTSLTFAQDLSFQGKKILLYTRNGEGYVHDNIEASTKALQEICAGLSIETTVTDDPAVFESAGLMGYDAVVFSNTNNDAFLNENQRRLFQEYIRSGRGFIGIHSACGSERDWPWFWSMLGGKFVRHPKFQKFDIRVIDSHHPSTGFLPATWKWEDECYFMDHLNPAMQVLLAVDLTTIKDDEKAIYPGTVFGDLFPLAWCHEFEGGRVWYTALGHEIKHYRDDNFRKHLEGGIQWVLTPTDQ